MIKNLQKIHSKEYIDKTLTEMEEILLGLYGPEAGKDNYLYMLTAVENYLESLEDPEIDKYAKFNPARPYENLKGKVFAISYPDNIYNDEDPTLQTLGSVLSRYFPSVNGIHILPERIMSHADVWPQDFLSLMPAENALELVKNLQNTGILNEDRYITEKYSEQRDNIAEALGDAVTIILDKAFNYHFNDGGFSQITRSKVDPRFGSVEDIKDLSKNYSIMLDYVVNHLDIDSDILEAYRKGTNSGDAFIIISPEEYSDAKTNGSLYKTFRPRPFPLYTGMRKHPVSGTDMNRIFVDSGLSPLDSRIVEFLSIYFKVENDQGLSSSDKRIFSEFLTWLKDNGFKEENLFTNSQLQANQKVFKADYIKDMDDFLKAIEIDPQYKDVFNSSDDAVYGEKFFVYTTFSESQADINPLTPEGFKMIIDDLYHLLSSGQLAMMRMDAIKYLWKEKGKKNFDMEEGNKFINLIRKLMALSSPSVLPLDEVNSPDPVVYKMEEGGGFAYLFGPVNSTITAFNEGTLQPLKSYYELYKKSVPENFVPFVMLSTHDGRSVQGLGVHRTDGHVSIKQFYNLKNIIEEQGGKAKFRTVPKGEISADTFYKVITEAGLANYTDALLSMFLNDPSGKNGSMAQKESGLVLSLPKNLIDREKLLLRMSEISEIDQTTLLSTPAIDFFLNWIIDGKTIYELCSTTRSSLKLQAENSGEIDPFLEASRLVLAQGYVLTIGQSVPAIYFNDLLGVKNDLHGMEISGKPRDLNRHKNYLPGMNLANPADPFQKAYIPLINKLLELRTTDKAFYPGSMEFEFIALTDTVFLNHPYYNGEHSFIIGNISDKPVLYNLDLSTLQGIDTWSDLKSSNSLTDGISGSTFLMDKQRNLNLEIPPYGMLWLK